jgi:hypothetical protein
MKCCAPEALPEDVQPRIRQELAWERDQAYENVDPSIAIF